MKFSWDAFDDELVISLAMSLAQELSLKQLTADIARKWMQEKFPKNNLEDLVHKANKLLIDEWASGYHGLKTLVRELQEANLGPDTTAQATIDKCISFLRRCKNTRIYRAVFAKHLESFGKEQPQGFLEDALVRRYCVIDTSKASPSNIKPWPYQEEAWQKLSKCESDGELHGLLVMPTGSGKTFTAAHWLMKNVVGKGKRVLWIAHRNQLLIQAWHSLKRQAYLANTQEREDPRIRMRIVSGKFGFVNEISREDDIILCSIGSLSRNKKRVMKILEDPDIFVVIDEAHHSVANTYKEITLPIKSSKRNMLLGLTATPIRMNERENRFLQELYDNNYIHETEFTQLVEIGVLSRPRKITVKTEQDAQAKISMTPKEERYLDKFKNLHPDALKRMGRWIERNEIIVNQYIAHEEEYGKTLIYAVDIEHAARLSAMFQRRGINAKYIAIRRVDYGFDTLTAYSDESLIEEFASPESGLNVLINVEKLTEGVDIPGVQTVFLARPTASRVLLQQMVGRALRGPKMGGTEYANLVSFEDHWADFTELESPFKLIREDIYDPNPVDVSNTNEKFEILKEETPNKEVLDAFMENILEMQGIGHQEMKDAFDFLSSVQKPNDIRNYEMVAMPHGWYVLRLFDGDKIIPVNEHEKECWFVMTRDLSRMSSIRLSSYDFADIYEQYFGDCDYPKPAEFRVKMMIECLLDSGLFEYFEFQERKRVNPEDVARSIFNERLSEEEKNSLIKRRFASSGLARSIYGSPEKYKDRVEDELKAIADPQSVDGHPKGLSGILDNPIEGLMIEQPEKSVLDDVFLEVIEFAKKTGIEYKNITEFTYRWSKAPIRRLWGSASTDKPIERGIRINSLLGSSQVSPNALKLVAWHEYIHICLKGTKHDENFYKYERRWPGYDDIKHELATLRDKYGIRYY